MKKYFTLFIGLTMLLASCSSNDDEVAQNTKININFKHFWGTTEITKADFNSIKFTNQNGEKLSIERLRYVVSNIQLTDEFGNTKKISNYNLVNVGEETGVTIAEETTLFNGKHTLNFTFGFTDDDNKDGVYKDLNSVTFNVPKMMGGGYHYMQFDGKYKNTANQEKPFNYHAIRAVKMVNQMATDLKDTSFPVSKSGINVQNNTVTITIKMDVSKWFINNWDLNVWDTPLMPNYDAQIQMNTNGKEVFSVE